MTDVVKVVVVAAFLAICWIVHEQESEKCEQKGGVLVRMECIDRNAIIK